MYKLFAEREQYQGIVKTHVDIFRFASKSLEIRRLTLCYIFLSSNPLFLSFMMIFWSLTLSLFFSSFSLSISIFLFSLSLSKSSPLIALNANPWTFPSLILSKIADFSFPFSSQFLSQHTLSIKRLPKSYTFRSNKIIIAQMKLWMEL